MTENGSLAIVDLNIRTQIKCYEMNLRRGDGKGWLREILAVIDR